MGTGHVKKMNGSEEAKHRLRLVLETLSGLRSLKEACEELGISEARFHQLRDGALQGALSAVEPKLAGRPPDQLAQVDPHMAALEEEVKELRIDLRASQVREEIAALMPHLLKSRQDGQKKTPGGNSSQDLFGRRRSKDGRRGT